MNFFTPNSQWSIQRMIVFWWTLFLVIQQAQRSYLLLGVVSLQTPTWKELVVTLWTGFRADLIMATVLIMLAGGLASLIWFSHKLFLLGFNGPPHAEAYGRWLWISALSIGMMLSVVLTIDMGYYEYNHQHLDFVFFKYIDDLFAQGPINLNQAIQQTTAELHESKKWGLRLLKFFLVEGAVIMAWYLVFKRAVLPILRQTIPSYVNLLMAVSLVLGLTGFHPLSMWALRSAPIPSATFYTLAQNPIWYAGEVFLWSFVFGFDEKESLHSRLLPLEEAVEITQKLLAPRVRHPYPDFPLVKEELASPGVRFGTPVNVLLLFIEGLDRRYLGQILDPRIEAHWVVNAVPGRSRSFEPFEDIVDEETEIPLTPFLDRLRGDSVFFNHFFSNGRATERGLFSTLCSYYPRAGWDVFRARYGHDYLCLPSVLSSAGYQTEMVIAQSRGGNRENMGLFLARNGIHRLYDVNDFTDETPKLGFGVTDGALLDFLKVRIKILRKKAAPFFLTTLTIGTHHPYPVPRSNSEVERLMRHPDKYVAALRYLDLELERLFTELQHDGLLENTVMFILGDHGRHEQRAGGGGQKVEDWVGHFMAPLFVWIDPSLRSPTSFSPRVVSQVASQVDIAPTLLGLNGLMPKVAPFMGRDLSCILVTDCAEENVVFLRDNAHIGLVDKDGFFGISKENQIFLHADVDLKNPIILQQLTTPNTIKRYHSLLALDISSQVMLEQNRIWSWQKFNLIP